MENLHMDMELREKLRRYLEESKITQTAFARSIGLPNSSAISQYLSEKGYASPHTLESKIREYFHNTEEAERRKNASPVTLDLYNDKTYLPTSISESIYGTIRSCHLKGGIAVECGDAGIGKTKAARKYARDYATAIYIVANPCISSVISVMKELCYALGLPTGRKDDMWRAVRHHLSGEPKVLIIDEAQHLPIKTVDNLRTLSDANPNLGIVFVGNFLTITSSGGITEAAYQQVRNRIGRPHERKTADVTKDDIAKLFPALAVKDKELNFLLLVAQSKQGIRGTVNLYGNAVDNEDIGFNGLIAMAKFMKINV
jgi:DNA transposition AAA+ family ATPase